MRAYYLRLLGFYLVMLALGVFHPFVADWTEVVVPAPNFFDIRFQHIDPVTNVILFLPLGVLLRRLGLSLVRAVVVSFLLSGSIELLQHWVAHRVAGIEDLLLNTAGGTLGAFFVEPLSRAARLFEGRAARVVSTLVLAGFVIWSAAPAVVGAELWLWHEGAVVTTASDPLGEYPWPGTVHSARLYAGAFTPHTLPAQPDWTDKEPRKAEPEMCRRMVAADAFTVDVDLTMPPADHLKPWGAILVYAHDFSRMNITLGHIRQEIMLRTKTRATPILGAFPDNEKPLSIPAFAPETRHRLTISFDGKKTVGFVDGRKTYEKTLSMPLHNGQRRFWLPRSPWGAWLYAFCAALVVAAAASGLSLRIGIAAGMSVALATELIQVVLFGRAFDLMQIPALALGAVLGAVSCVVAAESVRGGPFSRGRGGC